MGTFALRLLTLSLCLCFSARSEAPAPTPTPGVPGAAQPAGGGGDVLGMEATLIWDLDIIACAKLEGGAVNFTFEDVSTSKKGAAMLVVKVTSNGGVNEQKFQGFGSHTIAGDFSKATGSNELTMGEIKGLEWAPSGTPLETWFSNFPRKKGNQPASQPAGQNCFKLIDADGNRPGPAGVKFTFMMQSSVMDASNYLALRLPNKEPAKNDAPRELDGVAEDGFRVGYDDGAVGASGKQGYSSYDSGTSTATKLTPSSDILPSLPSISY